MNNEKIEIEINGALSGSLLFTISYFLSRLSLII